MVIRSILYHKAIADVLTVDGDRKYSVDNNEEAVFKDILLDYESN